MKHLKKFFESTEFNKEDILENFLFITDKLGEPSAYSSKFGSSSKWTITWDLKIDLSALQEASELITKLKDLTEDLDDILAASSRMTEYNINMSISNELRIELVPKDTGDDTFKFIKGYESRQLYVRINEVERFFNSRGLRVIKWDNESSYDEINQRNNLEITLKLASSCLAVKIPNHSAFNPKVPNSGFRQLLKTLVGNEPLRIFLYLNRRGNNNICKKRNLYLGLD